MKVRYIEEDMVDFIFNDLILLKKNEIYNVFQSTNLNCYSIIIRNKQYNFYKSRFYNLRNDKIKQLL